MKKVFSTVVALALVSSITATASAANNVWFQTNGPSVATGGVSCSDSIFPPVSGGPGLGLKLGMDTSAGGGTCTWPIRLMLDYQGDGGDVGVLGWALDLYTDSPTKVAAGGRAYGSAAAFPGANEFAPAGPHPDGYAPLLTNSGRIRTDGLSNPFGQYALMDFTITKTKAQNDTNIAKIYVRVGNGGWGVDDPNGLQFAGQYQFGTNAAFGENGSADTVIGPDALIEINNVPEPATLSLLALGGLALIRRRR